MHKKQAIKMETIEEIKKRYKDEWVLAEILKEDELGEPKEVRVIAHSRNRDDTYEAMERYRGKYVYHFYTGEIPTEGYAVSFQRCVMLNYKFDPEKPIVLLRVKIEGEKEIKKININMALDTGATYVMIPWKISEILGYRPELSEDRVDMITASGVEKAPLVTLKAVSALGKKVENVKATVHDLPQRSYIDGLLGLSFLKNFKLYLDFKKGVIELEQSTIPCEQKLGTTTSIEKAGEGEEGLISTTIQKGR